MFKAYFFHIKVSQSKTPEG